MENFNFNEPADVFTASRRERKQSRMAYLRFQTGAEAIRHAMEVIGADKLEGTIVESDDVRLEAADIRTLYRSAGYPLRRERNQTLTAVEF